MVLYINGIVKFHFLEEHLLWLVVYSQLTRNTLKRLALTMKEWTYGEEKTSRYHLEYVAAIFSSLVTICLWQN